MASVKLIQGQDVTFILQVLDNVTSQPYSLAGLDAATAYFPKTDGTALAATGTLISADLGKLSFTLDELETAELNAGEDQSIELQIDQGSLRSIVQFEEVLTVAPQLFGS